LKFRGVFVSEKSESTAVCLVVIGLGFAPKFATSSCSHGVIQILVDVKSDVCVSKCGVDAMGFILPIGVVHPVFR